MKYDLVFEGEAPRAWYSWAPWRNYSTAATVPASARTSAGAITAVLLAAGYSPANMLKALNEKENGRSVFAGFMGEPEPFTKEEIKKSATRQVFTNIDLKFVPGFMEAPGRRVGPLARRPPALTAFCGFCRSAAAGFRRHASSAGFRPSWTPIPKPNSSVHTAR